MADVNAVPRICDDALMCACRGNVDVFRLLADGGADVNAAFIQMFK